MSKKEQKEITNFRHCGFSLIVKHLKELAEAKKLMSKNKKEQERFRKEEMKRKYQYVFIDGKKQLISNFMVEPPSLFIGRGDNPNIGKIKDRIEPEDVTINCDKKSKFYCPPPKRRKWNGYVHDQSSVWLASYPDHIMVCTAYV